MAANKFAGVANGADASRVLRAAMAHDELTRELAQEAARLCAAILAHPGVRSSTELEMLAGEMVVLYPSCTETLAALFGALRGVSHAWKRPSTPASSALAARAVCRAMRDTPQRAVPIASAVLAKTLTPTATDDELSAVVSSIVHSGAWTTNTLNALIAVVHARPSIACKIGVLDAVEKVLPSINLRDDHGKDLLLALVRVVPHTSCAKRIATIALDIHAPCERAVLAWELVHRQLASDELVARVLRDAPKDSLAAIAVAGAHVGTSEEAAARALEAAKSGTAQSLRALALGASRLGPAGDIERVRRVATALQQAVRVPNARVASQAMWALARMFASYPALNVHEPCAPRLNIEFPSAHRAADAVIAHHATCESRAVRTCV